MCCHKFRLACLPLNCDRLSLGFSCKKIDLIMRHGKKISKYGRDGFHNGNSSINEKKNTSKIEKQINPDDATLIDQIIFILFSFFHGQISRINHLREI